VLENHSFDHLLGFPDSCRALVALSMALDAPQSEHHAALEVTARTGRLLAGPQAP